jgi:D-arginine dehydrogenase
MRPLPDRTRWVIVGGGFAGAATAWALGRAGLGPGVILEQETSYGFHASGRNAAIFRLVEDDPVVLTLALRSLAHTRALPCPDGPLLQTRGGLTLSGEADAARLAKLHGEAIRGGLRSELLTAGEARSRYPLLEGVRFDAALYCADEGIADIHALLTTFVGGARDAGFSLHTGCRAEDLLIAAGRVAGVHTSAGDVGADAVIDASGAWAGRLGRPERPLPLRALRRHLFVTGSPAGGHHDSPFAWVEDAGVYFRPEGDGLLLSPCDETEMPPGDPPVDPAAAELLADKLAACAPAFTDLPVRRSWACLRTFAPDRRPLIGADPDVAGLFHLSGLGGFGMTTSAAVGELMATLVQGRTPDWIDASGVAVGRRW